MSTLAEYSGGVTGLITSEKLKYFVPNVKIYFSRWKKKILKEKQLSFFGQCRQFVGKKRYALTELSHRSPLGEQGSLL